MCQSMYVKCKYSMCVWSLHVSFLKLLVMDHKNVSYINGK